MFGAGELALANLDVCPELEEDGADPNDNQDGHDEVGRVAAGMRRADIAPGKRVEARGRRAVACLGILLNVDILPFASNIVDGDQDGENNGSYGYEDDKEGL